MNEETKVQKGKAEPGASSLQRNTQSRETSSGKPKAKADAQEIIAICDQQEAALFHSRGYGGYIDTKVLEAIRGRRKAAVATLTKR